TTVGGVTLLGRNVGEVSRADDLRATAQDLRGRLTKAGSQNIVVAIIGIANNRPCVVISATDGAHDLGLKASNLVKAASQVSSEGGGRKPDLAQGGGQDVSKIDDALAAIRQKVQAV